MEGLPRTEQTPSRWPARPVPAIAGEDVAAWLLAFAPTVYLALTGGGGYDIVGRSQVGILLWWVVLLGALVGVLPRRRISAPAWVAAALLAAFLALTWIAVGWTQSDERTLVEAGRVASYLGMLVIGLSLISRRNVRWLLAGLASAIGVIALLAVLSKLLPSLYPTDTTAHLYATTRLRYPFDYSDGVGEFVALGLPLLLFMATSAGSLPGRALATAALPVVALALAMTVSRGGILAAAVGLIVFYAVVDDRLRRLAIGLLAAVGAAVDVFTLLREPGLRDQLFGVSPAGQRHTMLLVLILVCVGVAVVRAGASLVARRRGAPAWPAASQRGSAIFGGLLVAAVVIGIAVLIGTGADHRLWVQFKRPNPPAATHNQYLRLLSISGSHRYQYWQAASSAFHTHTWKGIGPGTFEFWWAQHQHLGEFVRNAHSLWMETLAELGIPGLVLIGGFFFLVLVLGAGRALSAPDPERSAIGTAVAGVAAFCAAAAFDWVWQIGVVPLAAMLLAAVAIGAPRLPTGEEPARRLVPRLLPRLVLILAALPALWAIARPLATTQAVRSSQSAAARGDFRAALSDALTAQHVEPGAASPRLQRALLLEQLGDTAGAGEAIVQAEKREPTNWRIWLVASRIATEADRPRQALSDYRRARALNPTSPIFRR